MATKRSAKAIGYDNGFGIGKENFDDLFMQFAKNEGIVAEVAADDETHLVSEEKLSEFLEWFVGEVLTVEAEHFRQFSPFEFTAAEFNASRDPDSIWEAYDKGVWEGANKAAQIGIKTRLQKRTYYSY